VNGSNGTPTITGFTPSIGTPGTSVTINGTNFDTNIVNNNVKFNISNAPISTVSATSIVTAVPFGGASGHLSVATPAGKAVSTGDFFIPPSPFTANDVEVAARMTYGETRPITIGTLAYELNLLNHLPDLKQDFALVRDFLNPFAA